MTDVALFKLPPQPGVRRVRKGAPTGEGKPQWGPYKVKAPTKCEDCLYAMYEANLAGEDAPPARFARQKRYVKGGGSLLVCDEHARFRRAEDALVFLGVQSDVKSYGDRVMS